MNQALINEINSLGEDKVLQIIADWKLAQMDEGRNLDPLIVDLAQGELPECCQGIYDDPEHPVPTCPHWEKAWVNYYGGKVVHYRNKLTGGSYFDYFNKYVGA